MSTPEGLVKKAILAALPLCGVHAWVQYTGKAKGRYQTAPAGTPDVIGYRVRDGRMVAIEVKAGKSKPSLEQSAWLLDANRCGVLCGVAYSTEDAVRIVMSGDSNLLAHAPKHGNV